MAHPKKNSEKAASKLKATGKPGSQTAKAQPKPTGDDARAKRAEGDWKRDAIKAVRDIMLRLIDREHIMSALGFFALLIVFVVAVRIPTEALGKLPDVVSVLFHQNTLVALLASSVVVLLVACVVLIGLIRFVMRHYKAEIERMASHKRELELKLDKARPNTYHEHTQKNRIASSMYPVVGDPAAEAANAEVEAQAELEASRISSRTS